MRSPASCAVKEQFFYDRDYLVAGAAAYPKGRFGTFRNVSASQESVACPQAGLGPPRVQTLASRSSRHNGTPERVLHASCRGPSFHRNFRIPDDVSDSEESSHKRMSRFDENIFSRDALFNNYISKKQYE